MGRATETVTGKVYVRLRFWVWRSWISEWVICHHISLTLFLISKRSSVVDFHIVRRSLRDEITFKISKTWCRYKAVLLIWACVWKLKIFSIFKNSIENIDKWGKIILFSLLFPLKSINRVESFDHFLGLLKVIFGSIQVSD